jgi:hypothetical protein
LTAEATKHKAYHAVVEANTVTPAVPEFGEHAGEAPCSDVNVIHTVFNFVSSFTNCHITASSCSVNKSHMMPGEFHWQVVACISESLAHFVSVDLQGD